MSDRWWTCTHDDIGLPGRPTCDPAVFANGDQGRAHLLARDEIARLTAERDALRAAVERVRPVVDGLAEWFDSRADSYKRGGDEPPPLDEITGPLGVHNGSWPDYVCGDCAAALRALLADVPEVAP